MEMGRDFRFFVIGIIVFLYTKIKKIIMIEIYGKFELVLSQY